MPTDRRDPLLPAKMAAHRALRYARWGWEGRRYARRRRVGEAMPHVLAESRTPLVRDPSRARLELADGKIRNLQIAAAALDGVVIGPGEILSFWYLVGEPNVGRGFRRGMELRSGCVVPSIGGGLCQLAGAVFELALRAGLTILEHHPHSLELAAEHDRVRPFGVAAAVLYPYRDVRIQNDLHQSVVLEARCEAESLVVRAYAARNPPTVIDLEERAYQVSRVDGRLQRAGQLWQVASDRATGERRWERLVLAADLPVMEHLPENHCYTCERACPNAVGPDDPEARAVRLDLRVQRGLVS